MGMPKIDWNQLAMDAALEKKKAAGTENLTGEAFWDKRAPSFAQHAKDTGYAQGFIRLMAPDSSATVLDMGCGGGTLALPLSSLVKEVTAVDFSNNMLNIVRSVCAEKNITNIKTVKCSWEDDWQAAGIGTYDVAVSSRSMTVDDMRSAVVKLQNAARHRVYISTVVGDGPMDRRLLESVGRTLPEPMDYIVLYNILYQMGIRACVDFVEEDHSRSYSTYEEAMKSAYWMFRDITPEEDDRLAAFMKQHLVQRNGQWTMDYARRNKWAVLWWDKDWEF